MTGSKYFPERADIITPDMIFELREGYTADFTGYSSDTLYVRPEVNRRGEHAYLGVLGIMPYNDERR